MKSAIICAHDAFISAARDLSDQFATAELPASLPQARLRYNVAANRRAALMRTRIVPALEASPEPACRALAADLKRGVAYFHGAYAEHIARWTPEEVRAEWDSYRTHSAERLAARIRCADHECLRIAALLPMLIEEGTSAAVDGARPTDDGISAPLRRHPPLPGPSAA